MQSQSPSQSASPHHDQDSRPDLFPSKLGPLEAAQCAARSRPILGRHDHHLTGLGKGLGQVLLGIQPEWKQTKGYNCANSPQRGTSHFLTTSSISLSSINL